MADRKDTQFVLGVPFNCVGKIVGLLDHSLMVAAPTVDEKDYVFIVVPDSWTFPDKSTPPAPAANTVPPQNRTWPIPSWRLRSSEVYVQVSLKEIFTGATVTVAIITIAAGRSIPTTRYSISEQKARNLRISIVSVKFERPRPQETQGVYCNYRNISNHCRVAGLPFNIRRL
ncbi:hypothetical protein FSOLCH5_013286 [Fusarium solani]